MVTITKVVGDRTRRRMQWEQVHESEMSSETISVTLDKQDDFISSANADGFTWLSDAYRETGEQLQGPNPLAYFLSAMAFCQFTHYTEHCCLEEIKLDSIKMRVDGTITYQRPRRFTEIKYEVHITSSAQDAVVRKLARSAAEDCFVTNTLKQSCKVVGIIIHNEKMIDDHA